MEVLEACAKYDIAFVCLPLNRTHLCQPLDMTFYGPMKKQWQSILLEWKSCNRSSALPKKEFTGLLKQLMEKLQGNPKKKI